VHHDGNGDISLGPSEAESLGRKRQHCQDRSPFTVTRTPGGGEEDRRESRQEDDGAGGHGR
jgi:hypothetical protein